MQVCIGINTTEAQELYQRLQALERQKRYSSYGHTPSRGGQKRTLDDIIHQADVARARYLQMVKRCPCEDCQEEWKFSKPIKPLSDWELMVQWINLQRFGMVSINSWDIEAFQKEMASRFELRRIKSNKYRTVYGFRPLR